MASIFKREHDTEGREVVEIGMNTRLFQVAAIGLPAVFLAAVSYAIGEGPETQVPVFLPVLAVLFAAAGFSVVTWMGRRSSIRIVIDGNAGKLLLGTADGETTLPMAEVSRAEFAAADREGSALHRLELVLKSGERVPATIGYFNTYAEGHQAAATKVINAALGRQMI